jgi:hypothetical protein
MGRRRTGFALDIDSATAARKTNSRTQRAEINFANRIARLACCVTHNACEK